MTDIYDFDDYKISSMTDTQIIEYAYASAESWFQYNIEPAKAAKQNIDFIYKDQWDAETRANRKRGRKPSLQNNMILPIQRKLIAEQRQAQPDITLLPKNEKINPKKTKIAEGLYRQISYHSNADEVYSKCFQDQCDAGWGALFCDICEESQDSINEIIYFPYIQDILRCGWDPNAQTPNKTDGDFCFIYTIIGKKEYKRKYGDDYSIMNQDANAMPTYLTENTNKDSLMLLNFWCREYYEVEYLIFADGKKMTRKAYNKWVKELEEKHEMEQMAIGVARESLIKDGVPEEFLPQFTDFAKPEYERVKKKTRSRIWQFLLSRTTVLERIKYPDYIERLPLVYVPGQTTTIDGQVVPITFAGVAQTSQMTLNYCLSEMVNGINKMFSPKILATTTNVSNRPHIYNDPDLSNSVIFDPDLTNPSFVPHVISAPGPDQSILLLYQQSINDIRAMLGRNDENLGNQTNAASGKAIGYRQFAGDLSVGPYPDNLLRGIAELARVTLERIPYVYDTERDMMLRGKDGKVFYETINKPSYELDEEGNYKLENDLRELEFDVEVFGGASFVSQKFAIIDLLTNFAQLDINKLGDISYDLISQLFPFADAQTLTNRIRQTITPPQIVAEEMGTQPPQKPPTPEQEIMQMEMKSKLIESIAKLIESKTKMKQARAQEVLQAVELKQQQEQMKYDFAETVMDMRTRNTESMAEVATEAIKASDRAAEREIEKQIKILESEEKIFESLTKL